MSLLEATGIRKRFGGVRALERGELRLQPGEVHVLIGSNGCGKSTLCKIIGGGIAADDGEIRIAGTPVDFSSPHEAAEAGIGVFYQELSLVPSLTVAENILLGREPKRLGALVDGQAERRQVDAALARFGAVGGQGLSPDALVSGLSADQRQIVEILKVLSRSPRILIFDEATSSLDARQVEVFFGIVRELKAEGRGVIFISHRMDEVFAIGDRVTVMRNGVSVTTLDLATAGRDEILRHMVGGDMQADYQRPSRPPAAGGTLLAVDGLGTDRLQGVSLALRPGEILGLGGLHGQGQSELLRALFGAVPIRSGVVSLAGRRIAPRRPAESIRHGVAYVSGDRGRHGVLAIRSVFENLVLATLARQKSPLIDRGGFLAQAMPVLERLKLKFDSLAAPVSELSGGNQQKVVIGRWLATMPRLLLLDDPTKGIDVHTKHDLYRMMEELRASGIGIILYSSEDAELLGNADRVLVFNGGQVVRELSGDGLTEFSLYEAAYKVRAA